MLFYKGVKGLFTGGEELQSAGVRMVPAIFCYPSENVVTMTDQFSETSRNSHKEDDSYYIFSKKPSRNF